MTSPGDIADRTIERVAKAISERTFATVTDWQREVLGWAAMHEDDRATFRIAARAALEAANWQEPENPSPSIAAETIRRIIRGEAVRECAEIAASVARDPARFPNIQIEAYSVASTICRAICAVAGVPEPPMKGRPELAQATGLSLAVMTIEPTLPPPQAAER